MRSVRSTSVAVLEVSGMAVPPSTFKVSTARIDDEMPGRVKREKLAARKRRRSEKLGLQSQKNSRAPAARLSHLVPAHPPWHQATRPASDEQIARGGPGFLSPSVV